MIVSATVQEKLSRLGIRNELDLILHLPIRYEDETHLFPISDAPPGQVVQVEGVIIHNEVVIRPRRQLVCQIEDSSGILVMRFLNFYGSQIKTYAVGKRVRLLGEIRSGFFGAEMVHPKCRIIRESESLAESMTPIYPTTAGLTQKILSRLIGQVLQDAQMTQALTETLTEEIIQKYRLAGLQESVMCLHNPPPDVSVEALQARTHPAWRRIKFDELLAQQLSMRLHYRQRRSHAAPALAQKNKLAKLLLKQLAFELTAAQIKVSAEISRDLAASHPMQRLLQGDVGSGKTIVAALAALQAIENGFQAALMAPTEILAEQHFQKLSAWFDPLGIQVVWLSGSQKKKQKQAALDDIALGTAQLAVGTHALFQDQVVFHQLGLAIVDEQHRFGVHQRLALRMKGTLSTTVPHQLMMSATPIPRTLSMSYFADLDVSIIDELPPDRAPIVTKLIADNRRDEIIARIQHACQQGKQVYWVCPLIEESETLQLQTAMETYENLSQIFPDLSVGLVHGRLAAQDKTAVMASFKQGEIQLLVATTVIEVGVDVPNASLMVIENAERMGLSQLHQLRGRVGRGSEASICILLFQQPLSEIARKRLKIIFEHTDGFEIARQDLQLRGPGEFLGARQSGVPMLRFADLEQDGELLAAAQATANEMLNDYPDLAQRHIERWLGDKTEYLRV
ncbi:MAG: ATP-dependent DNA helicase RecG [Nitrosomonas sp.]|uniref:ATP-dependent DNA helicase RecG n=1 Tax=Nitrosomonas sp. TaxID=42353 RepID=UPI00273695A5|nr:ATP-dependent DNA helicase RecG [Nitrosomonas sp.]MDP3664619.1 ATP-dependent DNA helicase RecG [Nitrosomonas sp.]MDZ4107829.1 ATP-dependent DNA helicase RecG [Nitrosomonas sp.]